MYIVHCLGPTFLHTIREGHKTVIPSRNNWQRLLMVTYGTIICPSRAYRRPVERLSLMEVSPSIHPHPHTHIHVYLHTYTCIPTDSNTQLLIPPRYAVTYGQLFLRLLKKFHRLPDRMQYANCIFFSVFSTDELI